jgi:hypothetical protein
MREKKKTEFIGGKARGKDTTVKTRAQVNGQ